MEEVSVLKKEDLAGMIDHTLLGSEVSEGGIEEVCQEAIDHGFKSVCTYPSYIKQVSDLLDGEEVKACSVVGFPHGTHRRGVKSFEAQLAIEDGADELDMVAKIPALKNGDYESVQEDIRSVVETARRSPGEIVVKVILETCKLSGREKKAGAILAQAGGADFVKTSTGFAERGATEEDVSLLHETVGERMGVKAAGGIKNFEDAKAMIDSGASRIGASSGVEIVSSCPD